MRDTGGLDKFAGLVVRDLDDVFVQVSFLTGNEVYHDIFAASDPTFHPEVVAEDVQGGHFLYAPLWCCDTVVSCPCTYYHRRGRWEWLPPPSFLGLGPWVLKSVTIM